MVAAGAAFLLVNVSVQTLTMRIAVLCSIPWIVCTGFGVLGTANPGTHVVRVALAATGVQFWVAGLSVVPVWQAIAFVMTSPFFVTLGAGLLLGGPVGPSWWSDDFTAAILLPVVAPSSWRPYH